MVRRLLLPALLLFLFVGAQVSAQNPITGAGPASPPIYGEHVARFVLDWSRSLQENIASLSRRVMGGEWSAGLIAFALAMLFGMIHIAGPGHGKVFAITYFSSRNASIKSGLLYSAVVNIVDSLSALVVVVLGYVVLRAVLPTFRTNGPRILQIVSYAIVVIFGVAHLISHLRPHRHAAHTHGAEATTRPPWLLALSVGLVPCPVSTILLVYGIADHVFALMAFLVLGVATGGFVTLALIAAAVIAGRRGLLRAVQGEAGTRIMTVVEFAASGAIIVVGIVLLFSAL